MVIKTISKNIKNIISNQKTIFNGLCSPAQIEYAISFLGISSLIISCITGNSSNQIKDACVDIIPYVIVSSFFIWILNALCKGGAGIVSWAVVLAPLILMVTSVIVKKEPSIKVSTERFDDSDDEDFQPDEIEDEFWNEEAYEDMDDDEKMLEEGLEIEEEDFSSLEELSTSRPNSGPSEIEPPTN